jgi:PAS domain S-box-containing protein
MLDLTDITLAEEAGARHAAELEAVLAAQHDAVLTYDTERRVTRANAAFVTRYGFEPSGFHVTEVIARVRCRTLDGHALVLEEQPTPRALRGETVTGQCYLVTRGDGQDAVVEVSSGPMRFDDRVVGSVTVWHDITERIRADEALRDSLREKEALLKEIHHRVKNNLQIIASLLNLQMETITSEEDRQLLLESQHRIRTLALVHEKLYGSRDFSRIPFKEYATELCTTLLQALPVGNISLSFDFEEVHLALSTASPLALILNELISNAFRHAFPGGREGHVTVSLAADASGHLELSVADDGVGFPEALGFEHATTLGLQMVSILAGQLHGSVALHREGGSRVTISFSDVDE